jgi:hypothetical protein
MTSRATTRPTGARARIVADTSWHGLSVGVDVTILAHDHGLYRVRPVDWRPDTYGEWVPERDLGDASYPKLRTAVHAGEVYVVVTPNDRAPEAQSEAGDPEDVVVEVAPDVSRLMAALDRLGGFA